jgi:pimeloyl-ACP methyl ester carboxylesterase
MWSPVIEALSESFCTYAVDNPYNFGRSTNHQDSASPVDYAGWLSGLFDGLGLTDGISLVGCSFGAWLAADYILHEPNRLAKSVWLSPPFAVISPPLESYVGGPLSMGAFLTPARLSVRAYLRWLMPQAVDAPWFDEHVDDIVWGLRGGFDERLALTEPRMLSDAELSSIEVPVLYVAGELEQMCSVEEAVSRLAAVAPQIETEIIPGAGHELPMGQPGEFSTRVLQFLLKR